MLKNFFTNSTNLAKEICKLKLENGDRAIDATMGNGNDTIFLRELVGEDGSVYSFDIQKMAIENTRKKLNDINIDMRNVELILDGHQNIDKYVKEKVKLVMFNLGYLPGADHKLTTKADTTIEGIEKSLNILEKNGVVILVIYYGHEGGEEEREEVLDFISSLNQKEYNVAKLSFINQVNSPPELICIEKRGVEG
ncbi:methyltransferase domain-containing protein [Clostridium sp. MSJ-11]|uniref:Methyltransferase domain-containing protein n=1 Tax=Clostridium mobile TaxID=2841512 RepID=A0ABS6EN11_9CLOT|nr:methyltransferase domain-containing protein [Clostridium mobile]